MLNSKKGFYLSRVSIVFLFVTSSYQMGSYDEGCTPDLPARC